MVASNHFSRPSARYPLSNSQIPDDLSAIKRWAATVRTEHEQADRFRSDDPNADHWKKLAHRFAPTTREKAFQDETYAAVLQYVSEKDSVLDVGAGAGRLAIPLADHCRHVTAVEPSETMRNRLTEQAKAWGLENVSVVSDRWEDAAVEPHDVVICAHVIYTAEDIEAFLRKLTDSSKRYVLVVVFDQPAMSNYSPLWEPVYGVKRIALPSLGELKAVLNELGIEFSTEPLSEWESRPFKDFESAYEESMARLMIADSSSESANRLKAVLEEGLVETDDGLRFKWATPHRPWLVRWSV